MLRNPHDEDDTSEKDHGASTVGTDVKLQDKQGNRKI